MNASEQALTTQQIIGNLIKVVHKSLDLYTDDALKVVKQNPDLFAHLIAWNSIHGEIRDTKIAFPVISLRGDPGDENAYYENAIAHLLLLDPRNLTRAVHFHYTKESIIPVINKEIEQQIGRIKKISSQKKVNSNYLKRAKDDLTVLELRKKEIQKVIKQFIKIGNDIIPKSKVNELLRAGVEQYLRVREQNIPWWNATVVQHRASMKTLYALHHVKPSENVQDILFGHPTGKMIRKEDGTLKPEKGSRLYPKGSVFSIIKELKNMDSKEAAGAILNYKIPFTSVVGAAPAGITKNTDLLLSLIESMSGNELITNSNMLSELGVMNNPILKAAFENAISKAKKDKRTSTLKAGTAASVVTDEKIKIKLEKLQEHRIDNLKGLEGDWLILADKSGSMKESIIKAREVAAFLGRTTKGKVYLVFFNTLPVMYDISGKSLEEIKTITSGIMAGGGTSIGCGLQLISDKQIIVNGIVICSDGGENTHPHFFEVYKQYEKKYMISPTIYLIHFPGEPDVLTPSSHEFSYEKLDGKDLDYYGLPNLSNILRSSRYTFIDEIMQVPLLTINSVLQRKEA
jgi:hypothetical protein